MTAVQSGRAGAGSPGHEIPRWRAYVALTKPRVIELLLVTTVPVMFLAAGGFPPLSTTLLTLLGGTMAAAGANVINQVYDRDIDAVMVRTQQRPLVVGQISVRAALRFGAGLSVASVLLLGLAVNWLSAALAAAAIAFYVFVYTMLLKRRTAQNIVWGGAAGCFPVLIGWSAVTGSLSWIFSVGSKFSSGAAEESERSCSGTIPALSITSRETRIGTWVLTASARASEGRESIFTI